MELDVKYYEFIDSLTRWNIENDVKARSIYMSFFPNGM
jgi:hypothetical protein